jgi:serine/threonine-protein kinase SRPK3
MCYYLVRIGHIFQNRYQVVGKLGFGISSTLWLARDPEYDQILWEVS